MNRSIFIVSNGPAGDYLSRVDFRGETLLEHALGRLSEEVRIKRRDANDLDISDRLTFATYAPCYANIIACLRDSVYKGPGMPLSVLIGVSYFGLAHCLASNFLALSFLALSFLALSLWRASIIALINTLQAANQFD